MGGEDSRKLGDQIDGPRTAYGVGDGEACGRQFSSTREDKWNICPMDIGCYGKLSGTNPHVSGSL